jgi:riboflavin kinase/FMN adenylyltransferase
MMNIGSRPTFGGHNQTLETHIFHFEGDIYGQQLKVWFVGRLRSEIRFDSREALMIQLASDAREAERLLNEKTGI